MTRAVTSGTAFRAVSGGDASGESLRVRPIDRVPTWFGVGGGAERFAEVGSVRALRAAIVLDPRLLVLGEGANLLVGDTGPSELVLRLTGGDFDAVSIDERTGVVRAGAGVDLMRLIQTVVRRGLGGIETLAGIPATVGGAVVMNAGGRFGSVSDSLIAATVVTRAGDERRLARDDIAFGYRASGLGGDGSIVVSAEFRLTPDDPAVVRERFRECMAYKRGSQPMTAKSAGCCFKNPVLSSDLDGFGGVGERVSAGLLLDRAGCKGLRAGGAEVSGRHANFVVTHAGASARDVIRLMNAMAERVFDAFGVRLAREVVVWSRRGEGA